MKARGGKLPSISETFFRKSRQLILLEEIYPNKERKDIKCISETKCTFGYLLSLPLKLKAKLKNVQFIFCILIALFSYWVCIIYIFVLFCLCDHLTYINIFI